jgi:hypothetical protein
MQLASNHRTYRRLFGIYLGILAPITVVYGVLSARIARSWSVADWLINYQGGFVRRGLAGETIFQISRLLHLPPIPFVIGLCLLLYGVLFYVFYRFAIGSSWNVWVLALLFSPATLSFHVLDPTAGYRKELLFLAAFGGLLLLLRDRRFPAWQLAAYIAVAATVCTMCHESLICYAPYFAGALLVSGRNPRQTLLIVSPGAVLALGAAILSATHPGNLHTAIAICSSLGYTMSPQLGSVCFEGGAIAFLGHNSSYARQTMQTFFTLDDYPRVYGYAGTLAALPLLLGSRALAKLGSVRAVTAIWIVAAVSIAGSMILFYLATDWGRWIYIHVVCIGLLLLFVDNRRNADPRTRTADAARPNKPVPRRGIVTVLLCIYATLWTLPHISEFTPRNGYVGLVQYVLHYRARHEGANQPLGPR